MRKERWTYDKMRRVDRKGHRWHFVSKHTSDPEIEYEDRPFDLYFRNDDRTVYGFLHFDRKKDNPYRSYEMMIDKIMNDTEFRTSLIDLESAVVWRHNWK